MSDDEKQRHINQQLFELVTMQAGIVNDLVIEVATLRKLLEPIGVTAEAFAAVREGARADLAHRSNQASVRVEKLIALLGLRTH